jgi:hypothetical protein
MPLRNNSGVLSYFSNDPESIPKRRKPLSVPPYGLGMRRHGRDISSINDQQRDLETHNGPHAFHEK